MNKSVVPARKPVFGPEALAVGKILGGAATGAVGGLLGGWVAFGSLVTAFLGLLGGAVAGTIGAALTVEQDNP